MDKSKYSIITQSSGKFCFQIGIDRSLVDNYLLRISDAHYRFHSLPFNNIVTNLQSIVDVSAIYSTNAIEGGQLSKQETDSLLRRLSKQNKIEAQEEIRIKNLMQAKLLINKWIDELKLETETMPSLLDRQSTLDITEEKIKTLHKLITQDIHHNYDIPGQYRSNPKIRKIEVGNEQTGGTYKPPKSIDIPMLMRSFTSWANSEDVKSLPACYRAPLVHYYYEMIHPFEDGNGRVGRMLEAYILGSVGLNYEPWMPWVYYYKNIQKYFTMFNSSRKLANKKKAYPNTEFVKFFLEAFFYGINFLHDESNKLISISIYNELITHDFKSNKINKRQKAIIEEVKARGRLNLKDPWFQIFYKNKSSKTRQRDIKYLLESGLLKFSVDLGIVRDELECNFNFPKFKLTDNIITSNLEIFTTTLR